VRHQVTNKRREYRRLADGNVFYSYDIAVDTMPSLNGLMSNVSDSGACIYTKECFHDGVRIKLFSPAIGLPRKAMVRWCRKVDSGLFKTGLSLI
jgi:hypothetical protein